MSYTVTIENVFTVSRARKRALREVVRQYEDLKDKFTKTIDIDEFFMLNVNEFISNGYGLGKAVLSIGKAVCRVIYEYINTACGDSDIPSRTTKAGYYDSKNYTTKKRNAR